jgi:hypothetical protein
MFMSPWPVPDSATADQVLIVTLPTGKGEDTIQLSLALGLEAVGAFLCGTQQPFLAKGEDWADFSSRATNMVCVAMGLLITQRFIQEG